MARTKKAAQIKLKARSTAQRHDTVKEKAYRGTIGAPMFTNGGMLMPGDVLTGHGTSAVITEAPHVENYPMDHARLSGMAPAAFESTENSSTSEDEILFVGKDPKARLAAMKELSDSDWSLAKRKRDQQKEANPYPQNTVTDQDNASVSKDADAVVEAVLVDENSSSINERHILESITPNPHQSFMTNRGESFDLPIHTDFTRITLGADQGNASKVQEKDDISKRKPVLFKSSLKISDTFFESGPEDGDDPDDENDEDDEDKDDVDDDDDDDDDDEEEILRDYIRNTMNEQDIGDTIGLRRFATRDLDLTDEPMFSSAPKKTPKSKISLQNLPKSSKLRSVTKKRRPAESTLDVEMIETRVETRIETHKFNFSVSSSSDADQDEKVLEEDEEAIAAMDSWVDLDPLDEFDVMDLERPSLQKKKKGKLAAVPQVSDDELQQKLNKAWDNDRSKKRVRKVQREELRRQGLLGRRNTLDSDEDSSDMDDEDDLQKKYPRGLTKDELFEELENMCKSSRTK
jgi:hypothetical protein